MVANKRREKQRSFAHYQKEVENVSKTFLRVEWFQKWEINWFVFIFFHRKCRTLVTLILKENEVDLILRTSLGIFIAESWKW